MFCSAICLHVVNGKVRACIWIKNPAVVRPLTEDFGVLFDDANPYGATVTLLHPSKWRKV